MIPYISPLCIIIYIKEDENEKNVTYSIKKGTLVIKGKGKMPAKMTFKNNKKIKKLGI